MARKKKKTRSRQPSGKSSTFLQPVRLDKEKLRQLYSSMLRCRMLTVRLHDKSLEENGHLGHLPALRPGSEAVAAGILLDLQPEDRIAPGMHGLAARLMGGEAVNSIVASVLGVHPPLSRRSYRNLQGLAPLNFSIIGQISLILGAAWAFKSRRDQHIAVGFFTDSGSDPGLLRDAMSFSIQHKLDVVHVVEVGSGGPRLASEYPELPVLTVEGDDAVAVYRVGQEAMRRARQGRGPALIECLTAAQANSTTGTTQPSGDAIARFEVYLRQRGFWSDRWSRGLRASFTRELDRAMESAEKLIPRLVPAETEASLLASTGS